MIIMTNGIFLLRTHWETALLIGAVSQLPIQIRDRAASGLATEQTFNPLEIYRHPESDFNLSLIHPLLTFLQHDLT